jgi:hypothetical protein
MKMKNTKLADAEGVHPSRLALLIAAPYDNEVGMHNNVAAMYDALLSRGFFAKEILLLEGKLNRKLLMSLIGEVNKRVATWKSGEVFICKTAGRSHQYRRRHKNGAKNSLTFSQSFLKILCKQTHEVADHG